MNYSKDLEIIKLKKEILTLQEEIIKLKEQLENSKSGAINPKLIPKPNSDIATPYTTTHVDPLFFSSLSDWKVTCSKG